MESSQGAVTLPVGFIRTKAGKNSLSNSKFLRSVSVKLSTGPQREFRTSFSVLASMQIVPHGDQRGTEQENPAAVSMPPGNSKGTFESSGKL